MSTPANRIPSPTGGDLREYIERRRRELGLVGDSIDVPVSTTDTTINRPLPTTPSESTSIPRGAIPTRGPWEGQTNNIGWREFVRQIPGASGIIKSTEEAELSNRREEIRKRLPLPRLPMGGVTSSGPTRENIERTIDRILENPELEQSFLQNPETILDEIPFLHPGYFTPPKAALGAKAGRAAFAGRARTSSILNKVPKVPPMATRLGGEVYETGVGMYNKTLGGPNPGQFQRILQSIPEEQIPELQLGMLEGFRENVQNMRRLSETARNNLLSPAGRERLKFMLQHMPEEEFDDFMRLLERGQFEKWRNRAVVIAAVYPTLRFVGKPFWKALTGE